MSAIIKVLLGLVLLGYLESKTIDLVQDPFLQDPWSWNVDPAEWLCQQCSPVPTVKPSVPEGYYVYVPGSITGMSAAIARDIVVPANVENVEVTVGVQVGKPGPFGLEVNFAGHNRIWGAQELEQIAEGIYRNVSFLLALPSTSSETTYNLKLSMDSPPSSPDRYISINEIHLVAQIDSTPQLDRFTIFILVFLIGLFILTCFVLVSKICIKYQCQIRDSDPIDQGERFIHL